MYFFKKCFTIENVKEIVSLFCLWVLCALAFCDPPRDPFSPPGRRDAVPYHGMRQPPHPVGFEVEGIFARKLTLEDKEVFEMMIRFSAPVDPRSLDERSVYLNGEPAGKEARFEYNRTGTAIRVSIENPEDETFSLEFFGLVAFNGEPLVKKSFDGIKDGYFFYGNKEEWKRF